MLSPIPCFALHKAKKPGSFQNRAFAINGRRGGIQIPPGKPRHCLQIARINRKLPQKLPQGFPLGPIVTTSRPSKTLNAARHNHRTAKIRQIPSCGKAPKPGARPRQAWRCQGTAGSSKQAHLDRGRGGVSIARRALGEPWGGGSRADRGREGCGMATAGPWRACAALACGWVRAEGFGAVRAQKRPPHGWPLWFGLRVRRRGPALRWQRRPGGWLLCRSSADPVLCR